MTYWQDSHRTLYNHDCRKMPELADNSMQMVVTSPPYWGLRKYAGEQNLVWGGNPDCLHEWVDIVTSEANNQGGQNSEKQHTVRGSHSTDYSNRQRVTNTCSLCGAWRGSFGLEPTVGLYIQHTIVILEEIKRVLRKDGVVFWNVGDSYASGKGTCFNPGGGASSLEGHADLKESKAYPLDRGNKSTLEADNLKPKDLCLIPFRVAVAAQEAGWWVRSVIIWNKPNPMPESVTDRPTESHEYILMLTKSARYYWDAEAVREAYTEPLDRWGGPCTKPTDESKGDDFSVFERPGRERRPNPAGRNLRSVWTFSTQPYSGAHFATYPEKLVEICVKAGTPEVGCCSKCGKPYERVIERTGHINKREPAHAPNNCPTKTDSTGWAPVTAATDKWQPACKCDAPTIPSTVLDPFSGSGTTLKVAAELNRRAVGYELSSEYCKLAVERNRQGVIL